MTTRSLDGETAGTVSGHARPAAPHPYRGRHLDWGERDTCTCGLGRDHDNHRIPSPRAARQETK